MLKPYPSVIFCIGFNKTGTTSLHEAFTCVGLNSLHDKKWIELANKNSLPYYDVFSDGNVEKLNLYNLKRNYKNGKFILNTRSLHNWLVSRCKHALSGFLAGRRNMYEMSDIVNWIKVRQRWHTLAIGINPFVFNIENKEDHSKLSDFINKKLEIKHINKREKCDVSIKQNVEKALKIANIAESNWHDII